jgi:hypothetical protein
MLMNVSFFILILILISLISQNGFPLNENASYLFIDNGSFSVQVN